jgi:hypothetical protein
MGSRPPAAAGKGLWIGGGILAAGILAAAVLVVVMGGKDEVEAPVAKKPPVENPQPQPPPKITVASVTLSPSSMELPVGQSRRFAVDVQPAGAPSGIRWESSNADVASIHGGEVVGMRAGSATIRAFSTEDESKVGSADVTVTGGVAVRPPPKDPTPPTPKNPPPVETRTEPDPAPAAAKSNKAILTITSAPPFAEVIVDGRFLGTTPVKEKELPVGKHKIQVTHRSFPPMDTVVQLGPGEKTIRFRLFR